MKLLVLVVALLSQTCLAAMDTPSCEQIAVAQNTFANLSAQMKPSRGGIWYVRAGEGRPLLFIHGWSMDHRDEVLDYEPVLQSRPGWQRIYVDLPGMGKSAATAVRDQDDMLRLLLQFIDQELGRVPFAIAGTSAGAYLARGVAAKRRDQVVGLVLRIPLVQPADAARDLRGVPELVAQARADRVADSNASTIIIESECYGTALAHKNAQRVQPAQALANNQVLDPIRKDPRRYALSEPLDSSSPIPVLIMSGREDRSVGYRDAWRLLEQYPRATYVALDRAEHGFPIDRMNTFLFRGLVGDWLDRVEEREQTRR